MHVGIAADHGGFLLKERIKHALETADHTVRDFGAYRLEKNDDYPDFVVPLARAVSSSEVERGVAICGSGVGACMAANKVRGVRAALITDTYSAHQGVEDDDMNIICLGGKVTGPALALELIKAFLAARFLKTERFQRRLGKIDDLERGMLQSGRR